MGSKIFRNIKISGKIIYLWMENLKFEKNNCFKNGNDKTTIYSNFHFDKGRIFPETSWFLINVSRSFYKRFVITLNKIVQYKILRIKLIFNLNIYKFKYNINEKGSCKLIK